MIRYNALTQRSNYWCTDPDEYRPTLDSYVIFGRRGFFGRGRWQNHLH